MKEATERHVFVRLSTGAFVKLFTQCSHLHLNVIRGLPHGAEVVNVALDRVSGEVVFEVRADMEAGEARIVLETLTCAHPQNMAARDFAGDTHGGESE